MVFQTRGQFRGVSQARMALIMLPLFPHMLSLYSTRPFTSFVAPAVNLVPRAVNGFLIGCWDKVPLEVWVIVPYVFG